MFHFSLSPYKYSISFLFHLLLEILNNIVFHFTVVFSLKYHDKYLLNKRCSPFLINTVSKIVVKGLLFS